MKKLLHLPLIIATLAVAACASNQAPGSSDNDSLAKNPVVANSVFFALNNTEIPPYYTKILTINAGYLVSHPTAMVQLQGNSSEVGSAKYNQDLSLMRAVSVKKSLIKQGVKAQQIKIIAYGTTRQTFGSESNGYQPKNQRVDIIYTATPPTNYTMRDVPVVNVTTMY